MRLIDADALLQRYDEVHVGPPGGARKLIEEAPTICEWVSVKDRLPDINDYCDKLCIVNGRNGMTVYEDAMLVLEYAGYGEWYCDEAPYAELTVSYWMPLPAPPET